jgi:hypothetical protein
VRATADVGASKSGHGRKLRGARDAHGHLLALNPAKGCFKSPKVRNIRISARARRLLAVMILRTSGF